MVLVVVCDGSMDDLVDAAGSEELGTSRLCTQARDTDEVEENALGNG